MEAGPADLTAALHSGFTTKLKHRIQSAAGPTRIPGYRRILVEFKSEHTGSACLKRLELVNKASCTRTPCYSCSCIWPQNCVGTDAGCCSVPEDRTVQIPDPGRFLLFHTHSREGSLCRAEERYPHTLPRSNGIVATGEHPQTKACSQACSVGAGSRTHGTSGHHEG